ncbi:sulfotransferase domain-containing protein [Salisaeta longa]|uniref:sulfotransferase domain-containing protein n=1 Tax=Salisaeta longa TaxID=503170 RepID=UPI0003B72EF2|nr:sulfotransferase domain-containing protein [Salisaeta longa]
MTRLPSLRVVYGHHKCATGWITEIMRECAFHLGLRHDIVHLPSDIAPHGNLGGRVATRQPDLLFYTNATHAQARTLPAHRGVHVVRDPRDVLVSAYFSHLRSHPTDEWPALQPHRAALQAADKDEGLLLELAFSQDVFDAMAAWDYGQAHVLELKMEVLTAAPLDGFTQIADFFGWLDAPAGGVRKTVRQAQLRWNRLSHKGKRLTGGWPLLPLPRRRLASMPHDQLVRILEAKSFKKLSGGRARGEEKRSSHYRKGVPGDWANHFTPAVTDAFKARYGDLLVRLGYASNQSW